MTNLLIATLLSLVAFPLVGKELYLLEPDRIALEYTKIDGLRDPAIPDYSTDDNDGEHWMYGAAINLDVNLVRWKKYRLFWENRFHMDATNSQVRHVGWFWEFGINIIPEYVTLRRRHHSRHWLEGENDSHRFPVRDEWVIQLNIYERSR